MADRITQPSTDGLTELTSKARIFRQLPPPEERRSIRRQAGLSQADLAAAIGVSPQAVATWEAGTRPRGAHLTRYLAVLRELREVIG